MTAPTGQPGVLVDRDGTIITDHGYVGRLDRVDFIEGAAGAIASFNQAGLPVALVTNQAGVARGYFTLEDVARVHEHMAKVLADHGAHIDFYAFCPYHPDGVVEPFARFSDDRKPGPGMAKAAALALGLDLARSWVVGDSQADMGLAQNVGACGVYVGPGEAPRAATVSFPSLASAAPFILGQVNNDRHL